MLSLTLEQISVENFLSLKTIRLHALQDSPLAFGSTYAKESQFSDSDWLKRSSDWNSHRSVGYLAKDRDTYCGIVAAFLDEQNQLKAQMISMWVAPTHRRSGVAKALINAIQTWAKARHARILQLTVTSGNDKAIEFYQREGFSMTGNTEPYPNDPTLIEYEMCKIL